MAAAPSTADLAQNLEKAAGAAEKASGAQELNALTMFMSADPIVKFVMIVLILSAVICLSLLFEKVLMFNKAQKQSKDFTAQFRRAQSPEEAAELVKKLPKSPMKEMFDAGMAELARTRDMGLYTLRDARDHTLDRVRAAMTIKQNHGIAEMGTMMTFMGTIGANAPFIGLFGTGWGIMNSFIGIANTNTTSLAVVAPGIAEALLATAFGLAAAIPAVLIYNYSATQIGKIGGAMDDFSEEFLALVSRDMDRRGA
ncbi:MAG: MotA/TolQ/ExbB proton channel family protein [Caulobacterales bacterium]